jgi:NADPH:quinone reductase-like Zn-dependent oxidoreductase
MTESQAWVFSRRGLPWDVLNLTTRPIPTLPPPLPLPSDVPKPEEWILVKVAFVGLNPGAIFQMTLVPPFIRQASCVPEMDFSGTVIDVWHPDENAGEASKRFKKGDKILAMLPASHTLPTGTGALAQHVRIPARYAVHKPEHVSFGDGAGCLLPGLTARQLVNESGAKAGDRVLVNAASGGIGTNVVQMLRKVVGKEGCIVGICSGKNAEMVKSIGADEVSERVLGGCISDFVGHRLHSTQRSSWTSHDSLFLQPLQHHHRHPWSPVTIPRIPRLPRPRRKLLLRRHQTTNILRSRLSPRSAPNEAQRMVASLAMAWRSRTTMVRHIDDEPYTRGSSGCCRHAWTRRHSTCEG